MSKYGRGNGRFFARTPTNLSCVSPFQVQAFNGRSQLMSTWKTVCDVIRGDTDDLEYRFQQNPEGDQAGDGIDLINTVRMLKRHYRKTQSKSGYVPPSETYGASRRPTLKQHEVIPGMFFDYYGEVGIFRRRARDRTGRTHLLSTTGPGIRTSIGTGNEHG